jgi:hypothetical protein
LNRIIRSAVALLCLAASSALADSPPIDFPEAISISDVVFHGSLVGAVPVADHEVMLFSVDRVWKGNPSRYQVVLTRKMYLYFAKGDSYFVCASTDEFPWLPFTGSWESVRRATKSDLDSLGPGRTPGIGWQLPGCLVTVLAVIGGLVWWLRRRAPVHRSTTPPSAPL